MYLLLISFTATMYPIFIFVNEIITMCLFETLLYRPKYACVSVCERENKSGSLFVIISRCINFILKTEIYLCHLKYILLLVQLVNTNELCGNSVYSLIE